MYRGRSEYGYPQIAHYAKEIPGQGQAAPLGLTFHPPFLLLSYSHLNGCRPLSVGHFDPLLSGRGDRGGAPFGAERRPLWGCPPATQKLCSLHHKTGQRAVIQRLLFAEC